jgi:enamine deaminase RidA (YjgF/YER057c/UK114 family)
MPSRRRLPEQPARPTPSSWFSIHLPHSPGIRVGEYIFLSGMEPVDPGGRNLGPIADQIRQTPRNMEHMLASASSGLDRIVKINVVLADIRDYDETAIMPADHHTFAQKISS